MKKLLAVIFVAVVLWNVAFCSPLAVADGDVTPLLSEDFEPTQKSNKFFIGADSTYTLTCEMSKKINGKMSALSPSNISGYSLFMQTDSRALVLGAKQKYSVVAKIKVTESFVGDGNFYVEVGADGNNFRYLRFGGDYSMRECGAKGGDDGSFKDWYLYDKTTSYIKVKGDYAIVKFTFTTSCGGYAVKFGINRADGKGQIAVDDVQIYRGDNVANQTESVKEPYTPDVETRYTETVTRKFVDLSARIEEARKNGNYALAEKLVRNQGMSPSWHLYPFAGGYMNDINGFFYYNGYYHVFNQFTESINGNGPYGWMHSVTKDFVDFEYLGTAIKPDQHYNANGVWSGNAFFDKDGKPCVVYYANGVGICLARPKDLSDPKLTEWVNDEANPVLPIQTGEANYKVYDVSNVWIDNGVYYMLSGNKTVDTDKPTTYLYKSLNLTKWDVVGEFIQPDEYLSAEEDMACPNLSKLGVDGKGNTIYLLTSCSHRSGVSYFTGKIVNERFEILSYGRMNNYGGNEMGQVAYYDEQTNQTIYLSLMTEMRRGEERNASGFNGVMTMPRLLGCDKYGQLTVQPLPTTVDALRGEAQSISALVKGGKDKTTVFGSGAYELTVKLNMLSATRAGVKIACGGLEQTAIYLDRDDGCVHIDYADSSMANYPYNKYIFDFMAYEWQAEQKSMPVENTDEVTLRIFVDNTIVEVYVNNELCMSRRIYPTEGNAVRLFAEGGTAYFTEVTYYDYTEATR